MSRLIGADRGGAGLSVAVAIALGVVTVPVEEHPVAATSTTQRGDAQVGDEDIDDVAGDVSYPGDGSAEAKLVAEEDARLLDVRSVISSAPWRDIDVSRPYRIATPRVSTLVLVPRSAPYTLQELAVMAPDSVTERANGVYLVREHIAVQEGASLLLQRDGGMSVGLTSGTMNFVSIVVLGGDLKVLGTPEAPIHIGSVGHAGVLADTDTSDGRAYLRVLGGSAQVFNAAVRDLGFWSGETGGLALTGIEPPDDASTEPPASDAASPDDSELQSVSLNAAEQEALAVRAELRGLTVTGNAFGIFASNAEALVIDHTTVSNSLVSGILLHRHVTGSSVTDTVSRDNAVDGFSVARASIGNKFERITASGNGRNGMRLDGRPLADGPSATGIAVETYGNNAVLVGRFLDNERYGIEISGGTDIRVHSSTVRGNEMGIVVANGARDVQLTSNRVHGQERQGIALRDAATDVTVVGNLVAGGETGIYLRTASATVADNAVKNVTLHGITVVGTSRGTTVTENTITGAGPSAVDTERSTGVVMERNEVDGWMVSRSLETVLAGIFQPLTIIWVIIVLLVCLSVMARARARAGGIRHPYEAQVPLASYSRGIVDRGELGPAPTPRPAHHPLPTTPEPQRTETSA